MFKTLMKPIAIAVYAMTVFGYGIANADDHNNACVMCATEKVKPKIVEEVVPVSDCLNEVAVVVYKDACKSNCGDFPVVVRKSSTCDGK